LEKELEQHKKPEEKLVSTREYKYDRAMQEASKRAQYQPKMISVNSKVKEF
jgi:hypothetical protein